jgi:hypothetical protein
MSVKCYDIEYKNYGKCLCLDNGRIRLIATIDVGPRIVFFGFTDGDNVLFEDVDRNFYEINSGYGVWYAYGGHRIWCAPEVMPETYLPDNSKVEAIFDGGTLTLTPAKTIFDKQFELVITMDDNNSVTIENKITNCSDKPVKFAPWSVTGLAAGGTEIIPLCREDKGFLPNRTMSLWSYSNIKDERFILTDKYALLRQDPKEKKAFKAGFNVTGKQIVYVNGRKIFRMTFDGYKIMEYPDFCCNFETYTNDLFLECELLGELRNYQPGETASLKEKWELSTTDWAPDKVIEEFVSKI